MKYMNVLKMRRIRNLSNVMLIPSVKVIKSLPRELTYDQSVYAFHLTNSIQQIMSQLTPKEFINIFPITKDYKGYKWDIKDYYSTMEYVNKLDQSRPIGEEIDKFLREYMNEEINRFSIAILRLMSSIRRYEGKLTIAEEWASENKIETYQKHKDNKGNEFLLDKMGRTQKITKPRPKHLKVVK